MPGANLCGCDNVGVGVGGVDGRAVQAHPHLAMSLRACFLNLFLAVKENIDRTTDWSMGVSLAAVPWTQGWANAWSRVYLPRMRG